MKKYIVLFMATAFLGTGCKDKYAEGFAAGETAGVADGRIDGYNNGHTAGYNSTYNGAYDNGYTDGRTQGHAEGLAEGQTYYTTNDNYGDGFSDGHALGFSNGMSDGQTDGYNLGYNEQYGIGVAAGQVPGYNDGYDDGHVDGFSTGSVDGYNDGYTDGEQVEYTIGYNDGYTDGDAAGYTTGYGDGYDDGFTDGEVTGFALGETDGYTDGFDVGYDNGYDDGWDDGYDAALGNAVKSSNPAVKMAAMVNSDLVDYSKLQKFDSASILEAGLALSHADGGTVDMEKLASLKEQHYLNQIAGQLSANFGLSTTRSAEIAKVAHQFNKLAGTRELTEKDANSFAVEVMGSNIKDVEIAMKKSLKGDSSLLNDLVQNISDHNGITPESTNNIITSVFFN